MSIAQLVGVFVGVIVLAGAIVWRWALRVDAAHWSATMSTFDSVNHPFTPNPPHLPARCTSVNPATGRMCVYVVGHDGDHRYAMTGERWEG
jgi:hypothetical protein